MTKPPIPEGFAFDLERIPVDESEDSPFSVIRQIAGFAASDWYLGPGGPYKTPGMTNAQINRCVLNEGIAHLLELGLIDIDHERLAAIRCSGFPTRRNP